MSVHQVLPRNEEIISADRLNYINNRNPIPPENRRFRNGVLVTLTAATVAVSAFFGIGSALKNVESEGGDADFTDLEQTFEAGNGIMLSPADSVVGQVERVLSGDSQDAVVLEVCGPQKNINGDIGKIGDNCLAMLGVLPDRVVDDINVGDIFSTDSIRAVSDTETEVIKSEVEHKAPKPVKNVIAAFNKIAPEPDDIDILTRVRRHKFDARTDAENIKDSYQLDRLTPASGENAPEWEELSQEDLAELDLVNVSSAWRLVNGYYNAELDGEELDIKIGGGIIIFSPDYDNPDENVVSNFALGINPEGALIFFKNNI